MNIDRIVTCFNAKRIDGYFILPARMVSDKDFIAYDKPPSRESVLKLVHAIIEAESRFATCDEFVDIYKQWEASL